MQITFACPACHAALCSPENVGGRVRCPACETSLLGPLHQGEEADLAPVRFGSRLEKSETEMDMTPMVDVTFLLLIFFMVTAAFALQKSIPLPAPQESDQPSTQVKTLEDYENDPNYVVVRIDSYNTYFVIAADWEKEVPDEHDLLVQLRRARESSAVVPTKLLVVSSGEALHEKVVSALDAGTAVGMEDVQLVTVEEE